MNLKQNILNKNYSPAPDCSGSPEVMKVIFSRHSKATAGSSCNGFRKKTLRTRAIAQSWNRLKKNKTVGKDYAYSIKAPIVSYSLLPLLEPPPAGPFDKSCKWEVHVLEHGKWRKTEENDKTGETVHYTFTQKSLSRKGIKIVVQKGNQKTEELVKPNKATEPKIVKVELLDSHGEKPTKPLSYGQTVIVKVHCTAHEYGMVNVTLWEDDAKGKGHNKINEKNKAQTKQAEVKRGIAETKFVLSPSFAKMAEAQKAKGSSSEGTTHEYYVTATIKDKNDASNNIEVNVPQKPVPPLKKRVPVKIPDRPLAPIAVSPKKPVVPAKPAKPAVPATPSTTPGITNVVLTKTSATTMHAAIYHNKLHGKKIRFKLMEDDGGKLVDDELINEIYTFPKDTNYLYIAINLKAIPVSKGDDLLEGSHQELFVDVEVLETHKQTKTGTLNVDISAFKPDPVDTTNKVVKIWESIFGKDEKEKKKENNCGEKYCIKKGDKSELIREINIRLAGFGGNVPTDEFTDNTEKMIKQFQRDYMKAPETGKICGNILIAIDKYCDQYIENLPDYKCPCQNLNNSKENEKAKPENRCSDGWGKGLHAEQYNNATVKEQYRKYEYPGIHRSTLWAVSAMKFYLDFSKSEFKKFDINRGYRCWADNNFHNRKSTNHFGKAADIRFTKNGSRTFSNTDSNKIRESIFNKYLNAKWWGNPNFFTLEKESDGAVTYVHVDCRDFSIQYMENKFFVKNQADVKGKSILQVAKDLGFSKTCACLKGSSGNNPTSTGDRVDPKTLKTSEKGIQFIKDWETFKPNLYDDDSDGHHCTIGYGHLVHRGRCDGSESEEFKKGITEVRGAELFKQRLVEFEKSIQRDITVNLYQYEFDALISLVFNTGENFLNIGGAGNGETQIKKKINNKDYINGPDEMADVTNNGLSGLVKRRKAEIKMFKTNTYDSTH